MKIDPFKRYREEKVAETHKYYDTLKPVVQDLIINRRFNQTEVMNHLNQHNKKTVQGAEWKYNQIKGLLDYLGLKEKAKFNNMYKK